MSRWISHKDKGYCKWDTPSLTGRALEANTLGPTLRILAKEDLMNIYHKIKG